MGRSIVLKSRINHSAVAARIVIILSVFFLSDVNLCVCEEENSTRTYKPVSRTHTADEILIDATMSYVVLWAGYAVSQYDVVSKITLDEFANHIFEVGPIIWDGDPFIVNFVGHPWYGSEYYLYFRSRGYSPRSSFIWVAAVSCSFEFLVESTSQPPSTNDLIVTPVLGGLLGYFREKAGLRLLNGPGRGRHLAGHILYPETMFWFFEDIVVTPNTDPKTGNINGIFFSAAF